MKNTLFFIFISCVVLLSSWGVAVSESPSALVACCNYQETDPIQLLNLLSQEYASEVHFLQIELPPKDWVKDSHLSKLFELLEDQTPCRAVFLSHSSHIPRVGSTVGREAAYLIDFYRTGTYRTGLKAAFDLDLGELKRWYKTRKHQ